MSAAWRERRGVAVVWAEPGPPGPHLVEALRREGLEVREACCAAEAVAGAALARQGRLVLVLVEPGTLHDTERALEVIRGRFPRVEVWESVTVLRARRAPTSGREPGASDSSSGGGGGGVSGAGFSDAPGGAVEPSHLLTEEELAMLLGDEPVSGRDM